MSEIVTKHFVYNLIRSTYLSFFILTYCNVKAQKVFSVQYANQADLKVFVVDYPNQADLKVYKVKYTNQAVNNQGLWFFTARLNHADKKIFFVKYANQADVKIYFVEFPNQAGWNDNAKKTISIKKQSTKHKCKPSKSIYTGKVGLLKSLSVARRI